MIKRDRAQDRRGHGQAEGAAGGGDPLVSDDKEIARLSGLAARAEAEGAITEALGFRNRASARAAELSATLDNSQVRIDEQRLSLASTFAQNGDTALLAFDYATAADRYGTAFDEAKEADLRVALGYLKSKGDALQSLGEYGGDGGVLQRAIDTYQAGLNLADRSVDPEIYGDLQNGMGRTLRVLGARERDPANLLRSIDVLTATLEVRTRTRAPFDWAETPDQSRRGADADGRARPGQFLSDAGGRGLSRGAAGTQPRGDAAGLGADDEQSGHGAAAAGRARRGRAATERSDRRLSRGAGRAHPRRLALLLGEHAAEFGERAVLSRPLDRAMRQASPAPSPPSAKR